nr:hypothetical protein [Tanacetum cinerariifolium]
GVRPVTQRSRTAVSTPCYWDAFQAPPEKSDATSDPRGSQQQPRKHRLQPAQSMAGPVGARSGDREAVRAVRHRRERHSRAGEVDPRLPREGR